MPTGIIRKPKPGLTELGGLTKVHVYETSQFRNDFDFPWRGIAKVHPYQWLTEYPNMTKLMSHSGIEYYNIVLGGMFPVLLKKRVSDSKYMIGSIEEASTIFSAATKFANFTITDLNNFMGYLDIEQILLDVGLSYSYSRDAGVEVGAWQNAVPASDVLSIPSGLSGSIIKTNETLRHIYFKNTGSSFPAGLPTSARIIFDVKEAEPKSDGKTSATQFSFLHSLSGKVAGYTKEKYATVDSYMGKDLLVVAQRPNGDMLLLGTIYNPLRMQISDSLGKEADAYVGSDISFMQVESVDFRPPLLASFLSSFITGSVPAYS
jgi:hypothetical protein